MLKRYIFYSFFLSAILLVSPAFAKNYAITATVTVTNPTCITGGSITAFPTGGSAPYTYLWSNGETSQKDSDLAPGTYTCLITDHTGSTYSVSATLTIGLGDFPYMTACCNDTIKQGTSVRLTTSPLYINSYTWVPSTSLNCVDCPDPVASPTVTTTYTVTGNEDSYCPVSDVLTIVVEPTDCDVYIPDAFSPNGDGLNDSFGPKGACIKFYHISVFNRWGSIMYSNNNSQPWNGLEAGNLIAQGDTYLYQIITEDYLSQLHTYTGKVTIVK